jgi:hypothetical protein
MHYRMEPGSRIVIILFGIATATAADAIRGRSNVKPTPQFSEIRQVVLRYFQAGTDYRPGELVAREKDENNAHGLIRLS